MEKQIKQILIDAGDNLESLESETVCQDLADKIMTLIPDMNIIGQLPDDLAVLSAKMMRINTGNVAHQRGTCLAIIQALIRKVERIDQS